MNTIRILAGCLCAALLIGAAPKDGSDWVPPATPDAVTHAVAHVNGASIAYTARAGTITLRNDKDQITARMFSVSHIQITEVIHDSAIELFRHSLVETAITRLHVKYRNFASLRR